MLPRECKITIVRGKCGDIVVAPRDIWLGETVSISVKDGLDWIRKNCLRAPIVLIDPSAEHGEEVRELEWELFIGEDE